VSDAIVRGGFVHRLICHRSNLFLLCEVPPPGSSSGAKFNVPSVPNVHLSYQKLERNNRNNGSFRRKLPLFNDLQKPRSVAFHADRVHILLAASKDLALKLFYLERVKGLTHFYSRAGVAIFAIIARILREKSFQRLPLCFRFF
jgi:hypothetical protein